MLKSPRMAKEQVELICRAECPFREPRGEYPCATADNGDVCIKVPHALTHVYFAHPAYGKKSGNEVAIYMDKEKVGILVNGVVTPQF